MPGEIKLSLIWLEKIGLPEAVARRTLGPPGASCLSGRESINKHLCGKIGITSVAGEKGSLLKLSHFFKYERSQAKGPLPSIYNLTDKGHST